jgi:formiminotetrahydrofolate cyclodeaminase
MLLDGLESYLSDLAGSSPVPGGGAAAAVTLAQGLALFSMVCNLTIGKEKFSRAEDQLKGILEQVSQMRAEALSEAKADMDAFNIVMMTYRMPAETREQQSTKMAALTKAIREAAEPPFRLMVLATKAMPFSDQLEKLGNPNVRSDVLVGRHLLVAGFNASKENVEVNLNSLPSGDPFVRDMTAQVERLTASFSSAHALSPARS